MPDIGLEKGPTPEHDVIYARFRDLSEQAQMALVAIGEELHRVVEEGKLDDRLIGFLDGALQQLRADAGRLDDEFADEVYGEVAVHGPEHFVQ